jgi:hypothetical protein
MKRDVTNSALVICDAFSSVGALRTGADSIYGEGSGAEKLYSWTSSSQKSVVGHGGHTFIDLCKKCMLA